MATQQAPTYISIPAGSDLSAKQFYFMDITSGSLAVAGAGTRVAGVLCDEPAAATRAGSLQIGGVAKVLAGGTITSGQGVASSSLGKAEAASGSAFVVGICVSAATVSAGEYAEVLLTPSGAVGQAGDVETVSSAGALNPGIRTTLLSVTGTVAYTLADGSYVGQVKIIDCTVAASTPLGTVTINDTHTAESTTHVFTAVGQKLTLEWRSTGWKVIDKKRAGTQIAVVGTTVLTGYDMAYLYDCQVTATVVSATTKGIPNGQIAGERCVVGCSVAASIPVGSITFSGLSLASAALTDLQAIGATTDTVTLEWTGAAWLVVANSGITLA